MEFIVAHDLLASDRAMFLQIAEADGAAPAMPDELLGDPPAEVLADYARHQWVHPQGVLEIDGELRWPYLLTSGSAPVAVPWANFHEAHLAEVWRPAAAPSRMIGPSVVLCGPGYPIFGHWLVDFLPKLWVLQTAGYVLSTLPFVVPFDIPPFARELLRMCGIGDGQLVELRDDQALSGRFLFPTTIHNGVRGPLFSRAAPFLRALLGIAPHRTGTRLFLSRAHAPQTRPCGNREEMELVAAEFGLSIIHPERLTLREQFHLIGSAGLVAGEYGSAMHSTLFADAGLIVCALRGSRFHPGFVQSAIGAALAQPTGYLFGHTNTDDPAQGFIVAAEPFRAFLAGRTR